MRNYVAHRPSCPSCSCGSNVPCYLHVAQLHGLMTGKNCARGCCARHVRGQRLHLSGAADVPECLVGLLHCTGGHQLPQDVSLGMSHPYVGRPVRVVRLPLLLLKLLQLLLLLQLQLLLIGCLLMLLLMQIVRLA